MELHYLFWAFLAVFAVPVIGLGVLNLWGDRGYREWAFRRWKKVIAAFLILTGTSVVTLILLYIIVPAFCGWIGMELAMSGIMLCQLGHFGQL